MTTRSPPLSPEQRYEGSVAAATMDPQVISSLNASLVAIPKLKGSENYKTWAWEVDSAFALYLKYSNALLKYSGNENIKWIITACLVCSLEPMIASALDSKEELCRMTLKELWKTIEKEYNDTPFDMKWNLLTELQSMKINNNYKNYSEIVKQFNECEYCLLKADLSVNELLLFLFLNIISDTAKHFKTLNQILENDRKISDYHYIKQKFNCFVNKKFSHNFQEKMENNYLNMMMSRWGGKPCPSRVSSDWNNNSSNAGLNLNNILNTLCNWYESSNHKSNNCFYKNKICNYCKKKEYFQKICFKKQHNDRVNDVTTNEKDDLNHVLINVFITFKESHKNWLTRYDLDRICLL